MTVWTGSCTGSLTPEQERAAQLWDEVIRAEEQMVGARYSLSYVPCSDGALVLHGCGSCARCDALYVDLAPWGGVASDDLADDGTARIRAALDALTNTEAAQ